jgi:hypothetical protein
MKSSEKLTLEIQKLNQKLDLITANSKFLVYQSHPAKFIFYNFLSGVFYSLGTLFGTFILAGIIIYFLSRINLIPIVGQWLEQVFRQIDWRQVLLPNNSI